MNGHVFIGTSGWTYADWKGRFYPKTLPPAGWLAHYASRFDTVELNVTTYRLPKARDIERWNAVQPGFLYSLKLSRLVTHRRAPGQPQIFVDRFFEAIGDLKPRIANVLAQFPPYLSCDTRTLSSFIDALPQGYRYVVEFRHPSWYCDEVYNLLRERDLSMCLHDLAGSVTPLVVTGPVLYIRLHGPVSAYAGSYRRPRLERWAETILALGCGTRETFVYFNNDQNAYAPHNAAILRQMLAGRTISEPLR